MTPERVAVTLPREIHRALKTSPAGSVTLEWPPAEAAAIRGLARAFGVEG